MVWCAWLMSIWPKTASFLSAARMVLFCCILLLSVTLYRIISFLAQSVGPSASYSCVAEVNSKLFHLQALAERGKFSFNQNHQGSTLHTHAEKEEAIFQRLSTHFGHPEPRDVTLDWELLGLTRHNLEHLEEFTEAELLAVVSEIAAEKAPGPNG